MTQSKPPREWTLLNNSKGQAVAWDGPSLGKNEFVDVIEKLPVSIQISREDFKHAYLRVVQLVSVPDGFGQYWTYLDRELFGEAGE